MAQQATPASGPPHGVHLRRRVAPPLDALVAELWASEAVHGADAPGFDLLPDTHVELCISAGEVRLEHGATRVRLPRVYLLGLLDHPVRLRPRGPVRTIAARLHAWGVLPLLGAIGPTRGRVTDLAPALDAVADAVEAAVARGGLVAGLDALEREQRARASAASSSGGVPAADRMSRRQRERRFAAATETSPKQLAIRGRFEAARDALALDPDRALAALAVASGFADQAHLTREFRRWSGRTPRAFAAEMRRVRRTMRALHVAIVQDRAPRRP